MRKYAYVFLWLLFEKMSKCLNTIPSIDYV